MDTSENKIETLEGENTHKTVICTYIQRWVINWNELQKCNCIFLIYLIVKPESFTMDKWLYVTIYVVFL